MELQNINSINFEKDFNDLKQLIKTLEQVIKDNQQKEWMNLKEGAKYAGVSYNTFIKFRTMGLKVVEIDGLKRVSKSEIDNFLNSNSF